MSEDPKPKRPSIYNVPRQTGESTAEPLVAVGTERGPGGAEVKVAMVNGRKVRFVDSYWTFFVAMLFVGPLALPLYWRNPRASSRSKTIVTVVVAVLTVAFLWLNVKAGKSIKHSYDQYQKLQDVLRHQSEGS